MIRYVTNAIVSAAGILGILAFSLAPYYTASPMLAVFPEKAAPGGENSTEYYQKLKFEIVCSGNSTSDATIAARCTTGNSSDLSTLNCGDNTVSNAQFFQLQVED